jgi:hypothetical protein
MIRRLHWAVLAAFLQFPAAGADTIRIASYNTELSADGPGLMLKNLQSQKHPATEAVIRVIALADADILVLQGVDWDHGLQGLDALRARLEATGAAYPYRFALRPNAGLATGLDLDGDGRLGGPGDAQGFGAFTGQGGMAVLSRVPVDHENARDFSDTLWRDLPGALLPAWPDGRPFPSEAALTAQRLSSVGHWLVPLTLPDGDPLTLITFQAGPPVFDGPEDRNGRRNHDELKLVGEILAGLPGDGPGARVVVAGGANLDPFDSDGRQEAIRSLLSHPHLQDPEPGSAGAAAMPHQGHRGPDALDTVDWANAGRLRVDYVLPDASLTVTDAGVFWPGDAAGSDLVTTASRHRLVWVDLLTD